jgi:superfamily II DNA or RNA helicase
MALSAIRERIAGLRTGSLQVLTSCDLISEGFDAPGVTAGILLRQTKSLGVYMQQIGRCLRPKYAPNMPLDTREQRLAAIAASDKPHAIILDHAGNAFKHGLADERREWSLDAKKRKDNGGPGVKPCPNCFAYCKAWDKSCRTCGHVFIVVPTPRDVSTVAGTLTKLDGALIRRLRRSEEAAAKTYQDLLDLGRRRGHSPKWAYIKWLSRGGDPARAR